MAIFFFLFIFHSLAVEYSESYKMQGVTEEQGLHLLVIWARTGQTWRHINLKQPRSKLLVYYHIKAINLETLVPVLGCTHSCGDLRLYCHKGFYTECLDVFENFLVTDAHLLVLDPKLLKTPFRAHVTVIV